MLRLEEVLQLKDGEDIRLVAKRHGITLFPGLIMAFLCIVIPFFFLFPLFSLGIFGAGGFMILVLVGLLIAWRTFAMWDGGALIVSSHRLIKVNQSGIFSRTVNEIPLSSVLEVSWSKKGIFGHMFNFGTVRILAGQEMLAKNVPQPQKLHSLIMDLTDLAKKSRVSDNYLREHRLAKIQKVLEGMDDAMLREVERMLGKGDRLEAPQQSLFQDIKPIHPNVVHATHHQDSAYSPSHHGSHEPYHESTSQEDEGEIRIKTLFGEDRTTKLKLMDE